MTIQLHNPVLLDIANQLKENFKALLAINCEVSELYQALSPPPKEGMGDIAFACFVSAKKLKKSPAEISTLLCSQKLDGTFFLNASASGPYINFELNHSKILEKLIYDLDNNHLFEQQIFANADKAMIEYSQPNTHKELHVGHMRNLCLGNALVNLYRYCGVPTISSTFPGDVGTHVAKCLWYFKNHNKEPIPPTRKGAWLGKLYTKADSLLSSQKGSEQEEMNRSELTAILKQLQVGSGDYYKLWQETRQWSLDLMNEVYQWANVTFDHWYWESEVDAPSVALVQRYYQKGLFIEDQGAIGIDLSAPEDGKLGFCLLIKSDGNGLYATKDIELARRKFEEYQIKKNIYIVDKRQEHHFKQVFKTLEKMGFPEAKNCIHLKYDFVELPDGAMSSRKGNIVPLQELIDQLEEKVYQDYLSRYDWDIEEKRQTASLIAAGAIKFGMNKVDASKKIVFDMNEWLKLDGESGPYIQYVYARIQSLLRKSTPPRSDYTIEISSSAEKKLISKLMLFHSSMQIACEQNRTNLITAYLYDLARLFNQFYVECPIHKAENTDIQSTRLSICRLSAEIIKRGLNILGIKVPDRM